MAQTYPSPNTNWSQFRGNIHQTGYTDDPGPSRGEIKWKTPLGRQWYSPPLVEDGKVYQVCPSRKSEKLICLDLESGETLWTAVGPKIPAEGQLPHKLRMSSRLVSAGDMLYVRALHYDGIFEVAKENGRLHRVFTGDGILEYRTSPGHILTGNTEYLVYPLGTQFHSEASVNQVSSRIWGHIACRDINRGERLWTFHVGQFFGEPALTEDKVYVGTNDGYLFCLDLKTPDQASTEIGTVATKRVLWSFKAGAPINSSPLVLEDLVVCGANDGTVYALTAESGQLAWTYTTGQAQDNAFIQFSKPAYSDGHLYIGDANGNVHMIDAHKGSVIEVLPVSDWVRARPAISGNHIIVASIDGRVTNFAPDGSRQWSRHLNNWHLTCDPIIAGDKVLVVTSDMVLHCLNLANGDTCWQRVFVNYPDDWVAFDEFQSSPIVSEGTLYVGTPGHFLYALDAESGKPQWRYEAGGEISSDPLCVHGHVYFGQQGGDGTYFCVDSETGDIIWKQNLGTVWAASNYHDGRLFVPTAEGTAFCLDAESGAILWRYPVASDLYLAPAIDQGLVYFGSWDNWLYALHTETGELAWKFNAETYLDSGAPAIADGRMFLPTMGPRFYCLDPQTGKVNWEFRPKPAWTTNASPAVKGDTVVMTVFVSSGMPWLPYEIHTYCLDAQTGNVRWMYPAGGLNGPTVAHDRVYFGSTRRGDFGFYCLDLAGNGDGTTECIFRVELDFNVLESCTAIVGNIAYVYAEDGYVYAIA